MCRISVREFTPRDFPESVYEIWHEAFGDSRSEIGHILSASSAIFTASVDDRASAERSAPSDRSGENFPDEENTRADEDDAEDSHCAGMLCTFTVSLNGARGAYIYAVCTRRRYRGMGVMRTLLTAVLGILRSRGMSFAFLVPARREYFPMYEKLGFDICVPGLSGTPGCGGVRTAVGIEDFAALRPTAFDGDFDRLYSLYLSSPQVSPTKGKALFRLSLEEYADGGICYTRAGGDDAEPDGYVIFEPNSKKSINILEIRRCYGAKRGIIDAETTPQVTGDGKSPEVGSTGNIFCDAAHADGDFGASDEDRTATQVGQAAHGPYVDGESCEPEPDTTFDHTHCSFDGGDAPIYNMGRIIFPAEKQKALFACFGGFRPGEITVDMFMEL